MITYLGYFLITFILSVVLTLPVIFTMRRLGIVDRPRGEHRKIHRKTIPLGGGLAIFGSFFLVTAIVYFFDGGFIEVSGANLLALLIAGAVLMIGGVVDDIKNLHPVKQLIFPVLAVLVILFFGIEPTEITNPLGGAFSLRNWSIGNWAVLADVIVFFWLMGIMYTTKLLDGLDGLVAGIVGIGALIIFFLSMQEMWFQPGVAKLAIIFAGAVLGFLVWNFHPAKIFLGEGGSLFTGFILGSLAIISGGKIATTLLVLGVPILDIARVIGYRLKHGKSIFIGDAEHLHFKLLKSGLSHRQAVLLFYAISLLFGSTTLFLQSSQKLIALMFLFVLMLLVGVYFTNKKKSVL